MDTPVTIPEFATAASMTGAFRLREASPVEALEAALRRSRHVDARLNAFLCFDAEQALAAAKASEARWLRGAPLSELDGVPLVLKDTDHFRGQKRRSGSLSNADVPVSAFDSPHVEGLRAAGVVVFARTAMADLGWKALGDSPLGGVTRNPWNPALTPGGSSAGSAVAVATGCSPVATGTDGGGSIRIPAAFTGVFGIKPTLGRVPSLRDSPFADMVVQGVLSASVEDAFVTLELMSRPNRRDPFAAPAAHATFRGGPGLSVEGLRVAVSPGFGVLDVGPEREEAVEAVAGLLEARGAVVSRNDPPVCLGVDELTVLWASRMLAATVGLTRGQIEGLDPDLAALVEAGRAMPAAAVQAAENRRRLQMRQMLDFMGGCDILLSAVTPVAPFAAGAGVNTPDAAAYPTWFHWARLGWLLNVVGLPAASYPWGLDRGGLPVGIQVAANPFREDLVRCVSLELERHAPVRLPDNGLWQ